MADSKCKVCRRVGEKLFLKGEKCFTPKCTLVKKPYPPGKIQSEKKHRSTVTEYGEKLREKQKIRNSYGIREKQFSNYVKRASEVGGSNPTAILYELLEARLDNVVYRMGLAVSRSLARQMVAHGHITINGRRVSIPSYKVSPGEVISVREGSKVSKLFAEMEGKLEKLTAPAWIRIDSKALGGEVVGMPKADKSEIPFDLGSVIEFYSRS